MKPFTGWLAMPAVAMLAATAAVLAVTGAQAQVLTPYEIDQPAIVVSDMDGPYAAMPPGPVQEYGPRLLPAPEVYTVVRDNGFSPLGMPRQRGFVYTIAVINRNGDDGRLVIDARNGRIVRFMPAYLAGDHVSDDLTATYGPVGPPPLQRHGPPRPPVRPPAVGRRRHRAGERLTAFVSEEPGRGAASPRAVPVLLDEFEGRPAAGVPAAARSKLLPAGREDTRRVSPRAPLPLALTHPRPQARQGRWAAADRRRSFEARRAAKGLAHRVSWWSLYRAGVVVGGAGWLR